MLPVLDEQQPWELMLDTSNIEAEIQAINAGEQYTLKPVSVAMFRLKTVEDKKTAL